MKNIFPKYADKYFCYFCILCALLGFAAGVFLMGSDMTFDETYSLVTSDPQFSFTYIIKHFLLPDVHPPLYNIILYYWNHLFAGLSIMGARMLSVIFAAAALICALRFYPKTRAAGEKYIFTALIAVNFTFISQVANIRSYTFALFWIVLLTLLFLNLCEKLRAGERIKNIEIASFGALALAATYTHYLAAITAGVYAILITLYALKKGQYYWRFAAAYALVLVFALPWLLPQAIANLNNLNGGWWATETSFTDSLENVYLVFWPNYLILLLTSAGLLFGVLSLYKEDKESLSSPAVIMPALALIMVFAICFALHYKINFFIARFFVILLPAFYAFCSYFMMYAAQKNRWFMLVNSLVLMLTLCVSIHAIFTKPKLNDDGARSVRYYMQYYPQAQKFFYFAPTCYPKASENLVFSFYFKTFAGPDAVVESLDDPAVMQDFLSNHSGEIFWAPTCNDLIIPNTVLHKHMGKSCFLSIKPSLAQN